MKSLKRMGLVIGIVGFVLVLFTIGAHYYYYVEAQNAELATLKFELRCNESMLRKLSKRLAEAEARIKEWSAVASWYGPGFHGRRAANGSIYDQNAYTVAHRTLPFGTMLVLEANGNRVPVVVTDRGPYIKGRDLDLSYATAKFLGIVKDGVVPIKVYEFN